MRLLLPETYRQARQDEVDSKVAKQLLLAAKQFFTQLMKNDGRRSDDDMNAFWAGAAALLPRDLFDNRQGRAAMRILGRACLAYLMVSRE